jgi:hypothetical protein
MFQRACLLAIVLSLSIGLAAGQTIEASAVSQSLLSDIDKAQGTLQSNQSPWQDPGARPQAEPLAVLREELPGSHIWLAFKPVDQRVRRAYWLQRQSYLEKDAAIQLRREARELLPELAAAIRAERRCYDRTVTNLAARQVAQLDNALSHMEYHAAMCILWSMADLLGLWDRQAALEVAEEHLADLCKAGSGKAELHAKIAQRMARKLDIIAQIIEMAGAWQPMPGTQGVQSIGPVTLGLVDVGGARAGRHFADHADLGQAFDPWRKNTVLDGSATPLVFDETNAAFALSFPAPQTRCLNPCPQYRQWQKTLGDYQYGWSVYKNSAAQQKPGCDWRALEPWAKWPGAKGAQNAGGL